MLTVYFLTDLLKNCAAKLRNKLTPRLILKQKKIVAQQILGFLRYYWCKVFSEGKRTTSRRKIRTSFIIDIAMAKTEYRIYVVELFKRA
jgi:hypothetical protein